MQQSDTLRIHVRASMRWPQGQKMAENNITQDATISGARPLTSGAERNREHMLAMLGQVRELEQRTVRKSARAADSFHARGKLLPRERLAHLLDADRPFFEIGRAHV